MKRVPLKSKPVPSLQDLLEQDLAAEVEEQFSEKENNISEIGNMNTKIESLKSDIGSHSLEIGIPIADINNKISDIEFPNSETSASSVVLENIQEKEKGDKSNYEKVTATLEPKLFWLLEDEKKRRRIAKLDYSYSEIIRDALSDYFIKQGREV